MSRAAKALSEADKQQRIAHILDSARALLRARGELPGVAEIARACGLGKGTVYLYFDTREAIFVALLRHDFAHLTNGILTIVEDLPRSPEYTATAFADAYVRLLGELPDLLPLAALAHGVLEQNLLLPTMQAFKDELAAALAACGARLHARLPQLPEGAAIDLLIHAWALSIGLWQALHLPATLRDRLLGAAATLFARDHAADLRSGLIALWRGALA